MTDGKSEARESTTPRSWDNVQPITLSERELKGLLDAMAGVRTLKRCVEHELTLDRVEKLLRSGLPPSVEQMRIVWYCLTGVMFESRKRSCKGQGDLD